MDGQGGIRLARGGGIFVVLWLAPASTAFLWWGLGGPAWLQAAGWSLLLLTACMLFFFRDPVRTPPADLHEDALAPADGRVVAAWEGSEGTFLAIYLSLLDVHVVRAPLPGTVLEVRRIDGGHHPAGSAAAMANAGVEYAVEGTSGVWTMRLLAGLLVRRVVPYLETGDGMERGARSGLIRFGSRVEITLPAGYRLLVEPGDRVRAGERAVATRRG